MAASTILKSRQPTGHSSCAAFLPAQKRQKTSHTAVQSSKAAACAQFVIRSSSSPHDCHSLAPVAILPRSRLPLSWLDCGLSRPRRIESGKLFAASIPALEPDNRGLNNPSVLAVRLVLSNTWAPDQTAGEADDLYVIERVKSGIYAIHALGNWVEVGDLVTLPEHGLAQGRRRELTVTESSSANLLPRTSKPGSWLDRVRTDDDLLHGGRGNATTRLVFCPGGSQAALGASGGQQSFRSSPPVADAQSRGSTPIAQPSIQESNSFPVDLYDETNGELSAVPSLTNGLAPDKISRTEPSLQEVFDSFRDNYLEALYLLKTSVAYFAKGPLARTRTTFQTAGNDSTFNPSELATFYRGLILPMKKMDIKYRNSVPEIVRNLVLDTVDPPVRSKRRRRKKKLGKNGLYDDENEYISRWWRSRTVVDPQTGKQDTMDGELRRSAADLRIRETQLQILLILETLAVELTMPKIAEPAQSRRKKDQDLGTLLELLFDRLCIWHAVSLDDICENGKESDRAETVGKENDNDKLKEFWMEVILPFYYARLPEQCKVISRKLGGHVSLPTTHPCRAPQKGVPWAQPETSAGELQAKKPRRTLQRVLTGESIAPGDKIPSLALLPPAAKVPVLKRESSELVLLSQLKHARGGIQKPRNLDNREVDLDTVAKRHEAKLKKMNTLLEQKKELDAAIKALRKPNRELVAREFLEVLPKKASTSHSRKPKTTSQTSLGQRIQVAATPKGPKRKYDALSSIPKEQKPTSEPEISPDCGRRGVPLALQQPIPGVADTPLGKGRGVGSVFETPGRPSSLLHSRSSHMDNAEYSRKQQPGTRVPGNLFKVPSPLAPRTAAIHGGVHVGATVVETPLRSKMPTICQAESPAQRTKSVLPSTPSKPTLAASDAPNAEHCTRHSTKPPHNSLHNSLTIYDTLGWDDDDDDDLA